MYKLKTIPKKGTYAHFLKRVELVLNKQKTSEITKYEKGILHIGRSEENWELWVKRQKVAFAKYRNSNLIKIRERRRVANLTEDELKRKRELDVLWRVNNPARRKEQNDRAKIKLSITKPEHIKVWRRAYSKVKLKNDPSFKIGMYLRSRLNSALYRQSKGVKVTRRCSAINNCGCTMVELVKHIESNFKEGMSWNNHGHLNRPGNRVWHIDHIRPMSSFDLTKKSEQLAACHYTNIRPLWSDENFSKGGKFTD